MLRGNKIKELLKAGTARGHVVVNGWIRQKRTSKGITFIELNDGSIIHNLQVIATEELPRYEDIVKLGLGACLRVEGELVSSQGKGQVVEIQAGNIVILGESGPEYPLQKKRHSFEFLRNISHLRVRTNTFGAVFRVRSAAAYAIHEFFTERDFFYIHTPIITASDCEGAGEMFHVTTFPLDKIPTVKTEQGIEVDFTKDFFKKETGLTVSGQLEGETFALALSDIYTFGPTFRAENSNTPRHVAEFWMIEPEMAFCDLDDNIALAQEFIKQVTARVMERCQEDIEFFARWVDKTLMKRLRQVVDEEFEVIPYSDAVKILEKSGEAFEYPVKWGVDLQTEHERYLTEKYFNKPVFVRDYPAEIKAFYMRRNHDNKTVGAMDLLVPGIGEIIGGSQREERTEVLLQNIRAKNLPEENYWWYLDTRLYGTAPHSGFGLGFARLILYLTGMANIRDVIPYPRTPGNAEF